MSGEVAGPVTGARMTEDYVRSVGRLAYRWGWPLVFMDDTDSDRAAIQPVINQVMAYPLGEYTGAMRTTDWRAAPIFPAGDATTGNQETQWVDPGQFFTELPAVMDEVPARAGEQA